MVIQSNKVDHVVYPQKVIELVDKLKLNDEQKLKLY